MKELLYTILELESWNQGSTCSFCPGLNKAVCQIRTRNKVTHSIVENDYACESCKEKFENDELPKCENCRRLKTELNINSLSGEYICDCIRDNESQEKELPVLPHEERASTRYERQINALQEKLTTAEQTIELEREIHEDSMKVMDGWYKNYQNVDVDKVKLQKRVIELEVEVNQLKEKNKKLVPEELAQKIEKIESYEKEIAELKQQLAQLISQQQTTQIEVPPKDKGIKSLFKFGGKK